ncbi:MAG: CehA/McbA family metallohydrolase, partial [Actinobacteria bacterium]|nr:CehA/McbA family metallohydrolase [Actinomycetota bacterium]
DSPDPFFSGVPGLLDWEAVAGPGGTLVTRWWAQQHTPGGAAHSVVTVPYYRDDACFDDGTGSDPGPHVDERDVDGDEPSDSTWTDEDGNERPRECWDVTRMDEEGYAEDLGTERFYQGSIGTHGLHILAIVDSDNAHTTTPVTEIDAEQRMVVLPGEQGNVGEVYGRGPEFPLQTTVTPTSFAPSSTSTGVWLAGDLHIHTTYSHDSWDPATEPHYDPTSDDPENEPYTLGNSPEEQFAVAASRGLDYLAITDHNDVRSQQHFDETSGVLPIPGFENSLNGHAQMLGAATVDDYAALGESTAGVQAQADLLRERGGVFQVNHPAEGHTGQTNEDGTPDLDWGYDYDVQPDTVEVWNISRAWQPPMPSASSNDDAVRYWEGWLDRGVKVGATGGSDNHYKATLAVQGPGQPTTWVFARDGSTEAVLDALRTGRTFISHQPPAYGGAKLFLEADADGDGVFDAMVGDTVPPGSDLRVRAQGAPGATLHVFADGGREARDPVTVTSADWTSETFTLPDATWVRAEIDAPDGQAERAAACDDAFGDRTTYCRNQVAVLAMTSAIYQRQPADLTLEAPGEGRHTDTVEASATLTFEGRPLGDETVTFTLGSASVDATTYADGVATATLPLGDVRGDHELVARFRGNDRAGGDAAGQPFTILREVTELTYTGQTEARGETVELAAELLEDDGPAVAGREVVFEIRGDRWTATTDERGAATATATVPDHGHSVEVTVTFAGDGRFEPSSDTATVTWGGGNGGGKPSGRALLAAANAPRGGVGLIALLVLSLTAMALRRTTRYGQR